MGLDNMPMRYPCENIAIRNSEGQINCDETQKAGRCAYLNEYESDPILVKTIPVRGIMGADCWYRGKYGNYLLEQMSEKSEQFAKEIKWDFYGDENDESGIFAQGGISEDACLHMSKVMTNYAEAWSKLVHDKFNNKEIDEKEKDEIIRDWIYAAWWLKFAGIYGEGSGVWY